MTAPSSSNSPDPPAIQARSYIISGRVQGVGFRYFVFGKAGGLGLKGWVKNRWDGGVEVHAEGEIESLEQLERHLHRGPSWAFVSDCHCSEVPLQGFSTFTIER